MSTNSGWTRNVVYLVKCLIIIFSLLPELQWSLKSIRFLGDDSDSELISCHTPRAGVPATPALPTHPTRGPSGSTGLEGSPVVNWSILLPCNSELFNNRIVILNTQERWGITSQQLRAVFNPGWCGSMDWVPACEPKGCQFDSQSGHMPGLQARSPAGGAREATNHT